MNIKDKIKEKIYNFAYKRTWYDLIYFLAGKEYVPCYEKYRGYKKAFLLMEPEYGNLGDHAIAFASEKFIKDKFPNYVLVSVSEKNTCKHLKSIINVCESDDVVFIQGGGNMGSLYPYIERMRRFCIKKIKNVHVVCMPVSVHFEETKDGKHELINSMKVYKSAINLCIFTRDKYSYEYLCKYLTKDKVKLVPDMVYYLSNTFYKKINKNEDYLVCLRKENESSIGEKKRESLSRSLINSYDNVFLYDTTVWRTINIDFREIELNSLFRMFGRAKCIITDRMHGMIISAIVGTPCVVLKSLDTKILGSYDWIKGLDSIRLIDSSEIKDIDKYIKIVCDNFHNYDFEGLLDQFEKMKEYILECKKIAEPKRPS